MPATRHSGVPPLHVELNPRLRTPAYQQIVEQIHRRTTMAPLPEGAQLPTVRALARRVGVNFNTVARAYRLLAQEGLLSTQPGRGTFVLGRAPRRKPGSGALHALTNDFVARAVDLKFSNKQITQALHRELRRLASASPSGDKHE